MVAFAVVMMGAIVWFFAFIASHCKQCCDQQHHQKQPFFQTKPIHGGLLVQQSDYTYIPPIINILFHRNDGFTSNPSYPRRIGRADKVFLYKESF